jgi:hypothetical protein
MESRPRFGDEFSTTAFLFISAALVALLPAAFAERPVATSQRDLSLAVGEKAWLARLRNPAVATTKVHASLAELNRASYPAWAAEGIPVKFSNTGGTSFFGVLVDDKEEDEWKIQKACREEGCAGQTPEVVVIDQEEDWPKVTKMGPRWAKMHMRVTYNNPENEDHPQEEYEGTLVVDPTTAKWKIKEDMGPFGPGPPEEHDINEEDWGKIQFVPMSGMRVKLNRSSRGIGVDVEGFLRHHKLSKTWKIVQDRHGPDGSEAAPAVTIGAEDWSHIEPLDNFDFFSEMLTTQTDRYDVYHDKQPLFHLGTQVYESNKKALEPFMEHLSAYATDVENYGNAIAAGKFQARCSEAACSAKFVLKPNHAVFRCKETACVVQDDQAMCCIEKADCEVSLCGTTHLPKEDIASLKCLSHTCSQESDLTGCCDEKVNCVASACDSDHYFLGDLSPPLKCNDRHCSIAESQAVCCGAKAVCTNSACDHNSNIVLKRDATSLKCKLGVCDASDEDQCCEDKANCGTFDVAGCPITHERMADPETKKCHSYECNALDDQTNCCVEKPQADCSSFDVSHCPDDHVLIANPEHQKCQTWECTREEATKCCEEKPPETPFVDPALETVQTSPTEHVPETSPTVDRSGVDLRAYVNDGNLNDQNVMLEFASWAGTGNDYIDFDAFERQLHKKDPAMTDDNIRALMNSVDTDHSGQISFEEFKAALSLS